MAPLHAPAMQGMKPTEPTARVSRQKLPPKADITLRLTHAHLNSVSLQFQIMRQTLDNPGCLISFLAAKFCRVSMYISFHFIQEHSLPGITSRLTIFANQPQVSKYLPCLQLRLLIQLISVVLNCVYCTICLFRSLSVVVVVAVIVIVVVVFALVVVNILI